MSGCAVSEGMEKIIGRRFDVLDHGFVRVIDYMGNDSSISEAARVSYGTHLREEKENSRLLDFLIRHSHTSPFEMCEVKLHVKAPIFVARQWLRHRTANVNEISARYTKLNDEYFLPAPMEIGRQSRANKQQRDIGELMPFAMRAREKMKNEIDSTYEVYEGLLEDGVPRELARTVLSLAYYTEFFWKIDAHNLMSFLRLRLSSGAQKEVRAYAEVIAFEILRSWLPLVFDKFEKHVLGSTRLSSRATQFITALLAGESPRIEASGMEKGEALEVIDRFKLNIVWNDEAASE